MSDRIHKLKQICEKLDEKEPDINKNFWAVNMHGDEVMEDFTVPEGVRLIMFCYSGRSLHICDRFDRFNWQELFLNEDASFNYCTLIAHLSQYSTLRDHFCVYEAGSTIRDLNLSQDSYFRNGIYKLPVKASVYNPNTGQVYVSSSDIFDKTISSTVNVKRISVNKREVAKIAKDKDSQTIIFTHYIDMPKIRLSSLIRKLQTRIGSLEKDSFTILLLTCRTGEDRRGVIHPINVFQELENLFKKYST
jgi:hypothetical protein